jgi:ACDE family multidrug resistance protein
VTEREDQPQFRVLLRDRRVRAIFAVTWMSVLGVASITPVLPEMIAYFGLATEQTGLVISVFALPGVILTLPFGILADRYGRERVMVLSLLVFGIAGALCAFARSFEILLALRFMQGAGAAGFATNNLAMIGDYYDGRHRLCVIGYNISVLNVATALYPAIGGSLASLGWRVPFALPILALPIAFWALFVLPAAGTGGDLSVRPYLAGARAVCRRPGVGSLLMSTLITFVLLYGSYLTYIPLLIGSELSGSALVIGWTMPASSIASGITAALVPAMARRVSRHVLLIVGFGCHAVALGLLPQAGTIWQLVPLIAVFGVGMGLTVSTTIALLVDAAPQSHRGAVMALNGTVLRLGQSLGPILTGAAYAVGGYRAVFLSCSGLALLTATTLLVSRRS